VDPLPARVEVVIVGAGLAGTATAWWLARRGVTDVAILEREDAMGRHASGRNAGMCRQIAEDDTWTSLCARGAQFLREPPSGFGRVLDVTGSLLIGDDDATLAGLAALAARHGIAHRRVGADEVARRVPAAAGLGGAGAIETLHDGIIDTGALLDGFARGTRVVTGAPALALREEAGGVEVVTPRGTIRARVVVCAAGAWAGVVGELAGARRLDFAPIRRHLFFLADDPAGPSRGDPFVWRVGPGEVYVRAGADGVIASACDAVRTAPGDVELDPGAADVLAGQLAGSALAARPITATWACQRTFAPEGVPRIGWDPDRPWLCWVAGLGGHGATASAAIGEDAAAAIAARL
jgi:D-arginine dehydrogenase